MAPGPRTKRLTAQQIQWLRNFKISHGYSMPDLNASLASPFKWRTLQKALDGKAINEASHGYIVQWLERYAPAFRTVVSGKDRAAGETEDGDNGAPMGDAGARSADQEASGEYDEPNKKTPGTTGTVRGSR